VVFPTWTALRVVDKLMLDANDNEDAESPTEGRLLLKLAVMFSGSGSNAGTLLVKGEGEKEGLGVCCIGANKEAIEDEADGVTKDEVAKEEKEADGVNKGVNKDEADSVNEDKADGVNEDKADGVNETKGEAVGVADG